MSSLLPRSSEPIDPQRRFPHDVLRNAEHLRLEDKEFSSRTKVRGFTLDAPGSQSFNHAIWLREKGDSYIVDVSISDVGSLVKLHSPVDMEAMIRTQSHSLREGINPMLPPELSQDRLSILKGNKRPTLTVSITLDKNTFEIKGSPEIAQTYIECDANLSFSDAGNLLAEGSTGPAAKMLNKCMDLAGYLARLQPSSAPLVKE